MFEPGLFSNVAEDEYHAPEPLLVSNTLIGRALRSPAHAWAYLHGSDQADTHALAFGRALHRALLEPPLYAPFSESTKRGREDNEAIAGIVAEVTRHPVAGPMLTGGSAELTARWVDPGTGLPCKARVDYYVQSLGLVIDVKTTTDAGLDSFQNSIAKYGYHRQQAHYMAGLQVLGKPARAFVFIACEKEPPYVVGLYVLDEIALRKGDEQRRNGMAILADCVSRNEWPGLSTSIQTISLPRWAQ